MVSRFATWIPFCPVERLNDLMIFVILMDWSPGYLNFRGLYWEREREGEGGRERERARFKWFAGADLVLNMVYRTYLECHGHPIS